MSFSKAQDLLRLAQMAASRRGGVSLEDICVEFGVSHRTAQRMTEALDAAFANVTTTDAEDRRRYWRLDAPPPERLQPRQETTIEALEIADDVILGDVATVTLGPAPNETVLRANGQTGLGLGIIRQATSNTLEISAAVHDVVDSLSETLPEDVNIFVTSDDAVFINGSIVEVLKTLGLAVAIVVAVIFVFLRKCRRCGPSEQDG